MSEDNIIKLKFNKQDSNKAQKTCNNDSGAFHTNPILTKMITVNEKIKNNKFSLKDLFR